MDPARWRAFVLEIGTGREIHLLSGLGQFLQILIAWTFISSHIVSCALESLFRTAPPSASAIHIPSRWSQPKFEPFLRPRPPSLVLASTFPLAGPNLTSYRIYLLVFATWIGDSTSHSWQMHDVRAPDHQLTPWWGVWSCVPCDIAALQLTAFRKQNKTIKPQSLELVIQRGSTVIFMASSFVCHCRSRHAIICNCNMFRHPRWDSNPQSSP